MRLIGSDGKQIGVVPIGEALTKAREEGLDLIEVGPNAKPPVCKIIEFKKFQYDQRRKMEKAQKGSKKAETKEFKFGPNIGENDLNIRIKRAREFLEDKNFVKITVRFKGREATHPEIGREKLDRFIKKLEDVAKIEQAPKMERKVLSATIGPR